jgi:hypothetical protein
MVQFKDRVGYRGSVSFRLTDENGKIVREYANHNLVVDGAKGVMAHLLGGDFEGYTITQIACGTSDEAADVTDTEITDEFAKDVSEISYPASDQVQFDWHLDKTEYNGKSINELGLLTDDDILFARIVLDEPLPKTSQFSMDVQWVIIFNNNDDEEEKEGESDGEPD